MSKLLLAFALACAVLISGPAMAEQAKVALLLPGVVTDNSVNQQIYEGLKKSEKDFGFEIAYSEKVAQAAQTEIFSDYARRGYTVLVGAGGEFTDAAKRVAAQFPDAKFVILNGAPTDGLVTVNFDGKQFGYVLGMVAGHMAKSGKLAVMAGHQLAAIDQVIDGYREGLKLTHPDGEVMVVYTNDWADVAKAKEAALNVISQGAEVILPYLDAAYLGVVQAAQEKNSHVASLITDTLKSNPEQTYVSASLDFGGALHLTLQMVAEGKLEKKNYVFGIGSEAGYLVGFNKEVPEDVQKRAEAVVEELKSGKLVLP